MDDNMIGFVLLNYNSSEETIRLARLLATYNIVAGIQIIDNASPQPCEDIVEFCDNHPSRVHFKRMDTNLGYARGNNAGVFELLSWVDCPILAIANPDIEVSAEALWSCVEGLQADDSRAAIAPLMLRSSDRRPTYPWRLPTRGMLLMHALPILGWYFSKRDSYPEEMFTDEGICQVDVLPGSLILVNTRDFINVGGFNEETFLYGEEMLLSGRFVSMGKTVALDATSTYLHQVGDSIHNNIPSLIKRFDYMRTGKEIYAREFLQAGKAYCVLYRVLSYLSTRINALILSMKVSVKHGEGNE